MKKVMGACGVAIAVLAWSVALAAHHSLVQFDTTTSVWVKGTVVRFDPVAPHARIYLDQTSEGGQTQRWMVDGPAPNQLARMGIDQDFLKAGDVIEVCGFPLKAEVASQRAIPQSNSTPKVLSGQPLSGHLLVMPNGKRRYWSDYGVLEKCLLPGENKDTLRDEAFRRR
jgi:hypothetical protein